MKLLSVNITDLVYTIQICSDYSDVDILADATTRYVPKRLVNEDMENTGFLGSSESISIVHRNTGRRNLSLNGVEEEGEPEDENTLLCMKES